MASSLGKKSPVTTREGVALKIVNKRNLQVGDRVYLRRRYLGTVQSVVDRKITLDTGKTLKATSAGANRFMKEVQP